MARLPTKDPTLIQVLSLYLLLLAFFVLLFNASRFDQGRVDAVTESLSSTFRTYGHLSDRLVVRSSDQGQAPGDELILNSFADLIRTEIAAAKIENLRRGKILRVTFGTDQIFQPASPEIRPERAQLVFKLSKLLGNRPPGRRHKAEVYIGSSWITPDQMKKFVPMPVLRAAAISESLMSQGALKGTVAGGVRYEDAGKVMLIFRLDQENRPEDRAESPGTVAND